MFSFLIFIHGLTKITVYNNVYAVMLPIGRTTHISTEVANKLNIAIIPYSKKEKEI